MKKKRMPRVILSAELYQATLHCPYCGELILEPEAENAGDCPHLIFADMECDPEDQEDQTFRENDLCFEMFESAPASRNHYVVFREKP